MMRYRMRTGRVVKVALVAMCILGVSPESLALGQAHYVETTPHPGSFTIAKRQTVAAIYVLSLIHISTIFRSSLRTSRSATSKQTGRACQRCISHRGLNI